MRRQAIQDTIKAVLVATNADGGYPTLAQSRVYIGRLRAIEPDRSSDKPPMLCIYFPEANYQSQGSVGRKYTELLDFNIECWAEVDPGRDKNPRVVDELLERALNTLVTQTVAALVNSQSFQSTFSEKVDIRIVYGSDITTQNRVGAAVIHFKSMQKGMDIPVDCPVYPDLQRITVEHQVRGSIGGSEPSDAGFTQNPDLVQNIPDLDQ